MAGNDDVDVDVTISDDTTDGDSAASQGEDSEQSSAEIGAVENGAGTEGAGGAEDGDEPKAKPTRKTRRQDYRAAGQLALERDQLARQNRELHDRVDQLTRASTGLTERLDRALPRAPDPYDQAIDAAKEKADRALARVRLGDNSAYVDYLAAQQEWMDASFDKRMAAAAPRLKQQMIEQMPKAIPFAVQQLYEEHPWAQDPVYKNAIVATMEVLAATDARDMRDPRVRVTTMREAAAMVGKQHGKITAVSRRVPYSPQTLGAVDPRTAPDPLKDLPMAQVDEAAAAMYPELSPSARRAKWLAEVGPVVRERLTR